MFTNLKSNIKQTLIVLFLPVILYFMVGPLAVYCANAQGFEFHYNDFFYTLLAIGLVIWIIGSIVISLLPKKVNSIINMLIFYLGIMSYLQDLFLNKKLSENDGSAMHWDELKGLTTVNTIIWIVGLVLVICTYIFLKKHFDKITMWGSGLISAMQLITFFTLLTTAISAYNEDMKVTKYGLTGEQQYNVASDNNIIVFIVDSYGTTQLEDGLKNNPELLSPLKDFTYYDNADCSYFGTFPSMTHMLTGEDVDFDLSEPDYLDKAWNSDSAVAFYNTLHNAGYDINLFSNGGTEVYGNITNLNGKIDNANPVSYKVDKKSALIRMSKISIYKYVPYVIKPKFEVPTYLFIFLAEYDGMTPINCGNSMYYSGLKEQGLSIDPDMKNALIIQHLDGTHLPHDTAADGSYDTEATMQDTQEGILLMIDDYLNNLKNLGLYDDATVIITADHGRWDVFEDGDDPQVVYFIKQAGESHDSVITNHAPISHDDFRATVLGIIGEDYSDYGTSIFDIEESELRERTLVNREINADYPLVPGEACNIYAVYTYTGDKNDIMQKAKEVDEAIYPILGW